MIRLHPALLLTKLRGAYVAAYMCMEYLIYLEANTGFENDLHHT